MRAVASYWSGMRKTSAAATSPTSHATSAESQRKRHMPVARVEMRANSSSMGVSRRQAGGGQITRGACRRHRERQTSEEALRNDQDVARLHLDVGRHVASLDQILQADRV